MAEALGIKLLGWIGLPMFMIGWIMDIPEPMRSIAILAGLVMMIIRFVFWADKAYHSMWLRREERRKIKRDRK
jgi:hypothetical protein